MSTWGQRLRERGLGGGTPATIPGRASFAYVFGVVLLFLLVLEAASGIALAAFYAPSSGDAWGSVAYIQDQATWGWILRGVHFHGGSAIAIVSGLHLVQTAIYGAYKKPRELVWWLGILLMLLVLAWAVTGYVLRWDQAGYWANRVEVGIAAGTPVIGGAVRSLAIGGNEYGNLTLTRFYTLHVMILPAIVGLVTFGHVAIARRLGLTTPKEREQATTPRWPDQALRNTIAIAVTFAILLGYVVSTHGVELAAPADPSQAYDARPLWYFRWLFELRELAGSAEKLVALLAPAVVAGFLIGLPIIDRGPSREAKPRRKYLGALAGLLAGIGALTVVSIVRDMNDNELAKREAKATDRALLARKLAVENGVPASGAQDIFAAAPHAKARAIYQQRCKGCHDEGSKDRKGPVIAAGHGNREWINGMLRTPSGDRYWGHTKLSKKTEAMKPFETMPESELSDIVELVYAQTGAQDVIAEKRERGEKLFESACGDCHSREDGIAGTSAPSLGGFGTRAYYLSFVSNPKSSLHMGLENSEMPRFDKDLSLADRDLLAEYLVWLRTATQVDVDAITPL